MTADTAVGYRVHAADGTGVTLGAGDMRQRMLAAGAVDRLVSAEWVRNAHRWVVWQQACIARSFPDELAGEAINAQCVLQRLLYRRGDTYEYYLRACSAWL
jgi:breast cancer 2 susceptibility protein